MFNCSDKFSLLKADLFACILTPLPWDFLPKNLYTIDPSPRWYPSYLGFLAILNALSLKTLSEAVLPAKSLKLSYASSCWNHASSNSFL